MKKFIPNKPGHYWYYGRKRNTSLPTEPIIIKVTRMLGREAWTTIDGYGYKVIDLSGIIDPRRIEDCEPPWDIKFTWSCVFKE